MVQRQLDESNIFRRTWNDLQINPNSDLRFRVSPGRLKFEACILTIQSMLNVIISQPAYLTQRADLEDYANALVDIHNFFLHSSNDPVVGIQYPFSKLISPLNQATQYLVVAVGQTNIYAKKRTESIQKLSYWLGMTLEQVKGLGDPPP